MVQLSGLTFDLGGTIEMLRDSVPVPAARLYGIGAGTSGIRRLPVGRGLYAETL